MLPLDGGDNFVVEKGHFPLVLVEELGEVLKVTLAQVSDVLHREQTLNAGLSLVLLHEYGLEEQARGRRCQRRLFGRLVMRAFR